MELLVGCVIGSCSGGSHFGVVLKGELKWGAAAFS